ncbi:uncharacterized protein LOC132894237 isoform X2 [Neoarius graeffei]|nr:uncharacterized protein LOC132894237 isoform X2 [Neoarius graeffei]
MDPDLESAPPPRHTLPPQQGGASFPQAPHPQRRGEVETKEKTEPLESPPAYQPPPASAPPLASPSHTRSGLTYGDGKDTLLDLTTCSPVGPQGHNLKSEVLHLPMVEVAGADGVLLVHRPWTTADMKESMASLPNVREVGGKTFGNELLIFCREFRPTTHELRRLLMIKMGIDWSKVSKDWPEADQRMTTPDWSAAGNSEYRDTITALCARLDSAFPLNIDMTKISMCKQEDGEGVSAFLTRLTAVHEKHSGLTRPATLAGVEGTPEVWEAHLRNSFMSGMDPAVAKLVKQLCLLWETTSLTKIEQYAVHAEKLLREKEKTKSTERDQDLHAATLTLFQTVQPGEKGTRRGRGRSRGRDRTTWSYSSWIKGATCYNCNQKGHIARNCLHRSSQKPCEEYSKAD